MTLPTSRWARESAIFALPQTVLNNRLCLIICGCWTVTFYLRAAPNRPEQPPVRPHHLRLLGSEFYIFALPQIVLNNPMCLIICSCWAVTFHLRAAPNCLEQPPVRPHHLRLFGCESYIFALPQIVLNNPMCLIICGCWAVTSRFRTAPNRPEQFNVHHYLRLLGSESYIFALPQIVLNNPMCLIICGCLAVTLHLRAAQIVLNSLMCLIICGCWAVTLHFRAAQNRPEQPHVPHHLQLLGSESYIFALPQIVLNNPMCLIICGCWVVNLTSLRCPKSF